MRRPNRGVGGFILHLSPAFMAAARLEFSPVHPRIALQVMPNVCHMTREIKNAVYRNPLAVPETAAVHNPLGVVH